MDVVTLLSDWARNWAAYAPETVARITPTATVTTVAYVVPGT